MTADDRAELTARRLSLRLDELAQVLAGGVSREAAARLLDAAAVATAHAVALDLLTAERARRMWRAADLEPPPVVEPGPLRVAA
jgi:predicted nucleic acid-binding protein